MQPNGMILIDKPSNMTSFGVVARIRRVLSQQAAKKVKVGHTGTLDPFATGLLLLVTGTECKKAGQYSKLDKVYEATVCLGKVSTTGDPEGEVTTLSDIVPTKQQIDQAAKAFTGEIMQRPPAFSAIKIAGQRAYNLARQGKTVEMPERPVTVYSCEVQDYAYPLLKLKVHVSSGTYIRSLASDIGSYLGTGAYCTQLRRTKVGQWDINDAKKLADYGVN